MSVHAPLRQEVLDFLLSRRSQPAATLAEPGPSAEQLETILTAAMRVPDHGKLAPWRFVLYRKEQGEVIGKRLLALAEQRNGPLDQGRRDQEMGRFQRSPLVVGVLSATKMHPKIPVWEQELSVGAVCMSLLNAASACGYGAQWLSEWYSFDEEAAAFLGCREGERFAGFIHIGTATQAPFERPRPVLGDICSAWSES